MVLLYTSLVILITVFAPAFHDFGTKNPTTGIVPDTLPGVKLSSKTSISNLIDIVSPAIAV